MPAKVVEPDGNQANEGTNIPNCGYLVRTDAIDGNGELKRIPFINKRNLNSGDLVVYNINRTDYKVVDMRDESQANIAVAVIPDDFFKRGGWTKEFKERWKREWEGVSETNLEKLNTGYTKEYIRDNFNSYDDIENKDIELT